MDMISPLAGDGADRGFLAFKIQASGVLDVEFRAFRPLESRVESLVFSQRDNDFGLGEFALQEVVVHFLVIRIGPLHSHCDLSCREPGWHDGVLRILVYLVRVELSFLDGEDLGLAL